MPKHLNVMTSILIKKGGAKHKRLSHGDLAVIAYELRNMFKCFIATKRRRIERKLENTFRSPQKLREQ